MGVARGWNQRGHNQGFTLVELMIVIAILGLLSVVLVPKIGNAKNAAKNAGVEANMRSIQSLCELTVSNYDTVASMTQAIVANIGTSISNPYTGNTSVNVTCIRDGIIHQVYAWQNVNGSPPAVHLWSDAGDKTWSDYYFSTASTWNHASCEGSVVVALVKKDAALPMTGANIQVVLYGFGAEAKQLTSREKAIVITK